MATETPFSTFDATKPASSAIAVTPSDGTDLTFVARALYVGTAGNLVVRMNGDKNNVTFTNVGDSSLLPIRVDRVLSTGTTATNIVALW